MICANCQHPASAHERGLFGWRCTARTLSDQPEWVDKGTACEEYEEDQSK